MTFAALARAALGPRRPEAGVEPSPTSAFGANHLRRVRRMLLVNSAATAAIGVTWGVYFWVAGLWLGLALEAATVVCAATAAALGLQGRNRPASRVLIATVWLLVCFGAVFIDPPVPGIGRSIHHFLLVLGVMSFLLMRDEAPWLRRAVPLTCFLTWAAFASFDLGVVTAIALPFHVRVNAGWVNCFAAVLMVHVTLHVTLADVAEASAETNELREALLHGEFQLHYQPQVDADGRLLGAESLIRWDHPRRGMVPPADFIALAEKSGLMLPMGNWVLKTACEQLVVWGRRPETASLVLAINVSTVQFSQPDFVPTVLNILQRTGADPRRLKLEITESMLARDLDDLVAKMLRLKAEGVGCSLDDFGTGFSSLSYLRRLPLDQLKIDSSFVRHMLGSGKDAAIVQAVITLGQSMDLSIIAEGVETEEQRRFLLARGCRAYQGFLFSKALPADDFAAFARRSHAGAPGRLVTAAAAWVP